ncbi:MAG: peptidase [Firmicutes bacterium HGW-Firmicutes-13]|nr:MAG: peptidase [Firmicutes bacterium HGW-Firmicutes-13]
MIADAHCDTVHRFFLPSDEYDFKNRNDSGHIDLPRLKEGGIKVQVFALYIEPEYNPDRSLKRCLILYDQLIRTLQDCREEIELVRSSDEMEDALKKDKIAAFISIEGGEALEGSLAVLRVLYSLGIRFLTLTWNHRNQIADGVGEKETGGGLTRFGREVIKEMNRLEMVIDVSHLSEAGFWEVMELSESPVIASHSNAAALCSHPRNLKDEQIKALADKGGLIGINFYPPFVGSQKADIPFLLDHIDHMVNLVGIDYIGLGSDFDGIKETLVGLEDVSKLPNLTHELITRGYNDKDIKKIYGENFLNFIKKNLKAAGGKK